MSPPWLPRPTLVAKSPVVPAETSVAGAGEVRVAIAFIFHDVGELKVVPRRDQGHPRHARLLLGAHQHLETLAGQQRGDGGHSTDVGVHASLSPVPVSSVPDNFTPGQPVYLTCAK